MTTPVRDPGPCVVRKVEVKTEDVDATFEDSLSRFQQFIEKQGYPREVVWIACDDLIVTGKGFFYVRVPDVRESEFRHECCLSKEQGSRRAFFLTLSAWVTASRSAMRGYRVT